MAQKSDDSVHILEGKAILYKREGTPAWQVRYRVDGKKLRNTTNAIDLDKTEERAVEIVMNALCAIRARIPAALGF